MATALEDLKILQAAEVIADEIWKQVGTWDAFARDTLGKQLVRAADSIGANIAESYGRFSYGEKLQFLYYARGSLFETKYWLNRAGKRELCTQNQHHDYAAQLAIVGQQLNAFAASLKSQRRENANGNKHELSEERAPYSTAPLESTPDHLLTEQDLFWLCEHADCDLVTDNPNTPALNLQSPISNIHAPN
jgi:four helix bundle protein